MAAGPARRAVPCPLCNEKFFPASLPFHQKQCEKRRGQRIVPCPYCGTEVSQLALPEHVKICPKGAGGRGKKEAPSRSTGSSGGAAAQSTLRPEQAQAPAPGEGNYDPQVLDDGRMGCVYCGRFFNPDRIDKHQQICGKLKTARPKGVDGEATQAPTKVFNSHAVRVGNGPAFVSQAKYQQKQERMLQETMQSRTRSREPAWRRAHAEFQAACKAGRGESVPAPASRSTPRKNGVTCPHCSRVFDANAADRHIPICARVQNRPKPPPSPARPHSRGSSSSAANRSARGAADSPSATLRPPSEPDSPVTPVSRRSSSNGVQRQRITDSSPAPNAREPGRSSSCGRLPAVGTPKSAGGALRAARDLKRQSSVDKLQSSCDKLPQLASPPGSSQSTTMYNSTSSTGSSWVRKPPTAPRHKAMDATTLAGDRYSTDDDMNESQVSLSHPSSSAVARVGLRRCSMMYRLLSQVPEDVLARELIECGVDTAADLDQEGLIEAIIEQLA